MLALDGEALETTSFTKSLAVVAYFRSKTNPVSFFALKYEEDVKEFLKCWDGDVITSEDNVMHKLDNSICDYDSMIIHLHFSYIPQ